MVRKIFTAFLLLLSFSSYSQADSTEKLYMSLLTCGVGEEIWETFGHTAIRVKDPATGTDIVYNYGTFNGFEEDFELKFMRGKLNYYVSYYPYQNFLEEYQYAGRSVQEQELKIGEAQKQEIYEFLQYNALPENRNYKYDFLYDNCATRIRDVFPEALGNKFQFGQALSPDSKITFRQIINQYLYKEHWERFGINLLLGMKVDKVMTNKESMFLPDFLRDGVGEGTVNGKRIATEPVTVLEGRPLPSAGFNGPLILTTIVALLTMAGVLLRPLRFLGRFMSALLLFVTGLLGCLMLFMWLGTDHQACQNNLNVLWALPTNLFLAFASKRNKGKYALLAMVLILVSLLLHLFGVQQLPLTELWPLLLALLFVYGMIYRGKKLRSNG